MDRIPKVLYTVADLMDADDARCIATCGSPVGIPASYGVHLIWEAVHGSKEAWQTEWVRLARAESLTAAETWSADLNRLQHDVAALIYPGGANGGGLTATEVRALADQHTT